MKLAVIGTFYQRHERTAALLQRVLVESSRQPDEFWVMCEGWDDVRAVRTIDPRAKVIHLETPEGLVPYSHKINYVLDRTDADAIVYLDNGSMPHPDKYRVMVEGLEEHPEWGAVYCGQLRTGYMQDTSPAESPISDPYCVLNYTQVMHRPTADRWSLDLTDATPTDFVDALFWRALAQRLGEFYPVAVGQILDEHHMESPTAVGL